MPCGVNRKGRNSKWVSQKRSRKKSRPRWGAVDDYSAGRCRWVAGISRPNRNVRPSEAVEQTTSDRLQREEGRVERGVVGKEESRAERPPVMSMKYEKVGRNFNKFHLNLLTLPPRSPFTSIFYAAFHAKPNRATRGLAILSPDFRRSNAGRLETYIPHLACTIHVYTSFTSPFYTSCESGFQWKQSRHTRSIGHGILPQVAVAAFNE